MDAMGKYITGFIVGYFVCMIVSVVMKSKNNDDE
jgi:hypothetical protein